MDCMTVGGSEPPSDGDITRADFAALPEPPRGWAWELRAGRLELTHMPVVGWHWLVVLAALDYWKALGHTVLGEQYIADSGFMRGRTGKNNFVADGVVFKRGYDPDLDVATHDAANIQAVIEAVSNESEERDAGEKLAVYADLGVPHYWIIRKAPEARKDGRISKYELAGGAYKPTGTCLISELTPPAAVEQ